MSVRILFAPGGETTDLVSVDDRAFNYGDGLFESIRVHAGRFVWWEAHWHRLMRGAAVLGMECAGSDDVMARLASWRSPHRNGVLKMLLSRGTGGRGYAPMPNATSTLTLSWHPLPSPVPAAGLRLRWCDLRLGIQPRLAGLKHCNRLEQVLARAEWSDPDIHEGLLCDALGAVTCAISGNLFARIGGCWYTPPLDRCGIAGICREWLLREGLARERRLTAAEVEAAQALFLCNSVRGILPVRALAGREFAPHPEVAALRRRLAEAEPAFAAPDAG